MLPAQLSREDAMTDRAELETLVRETYSARVHGDMDALMRLWDPNARFELHGDPAASPVPGVAVGTESIRTHLANLVRAFTFHSYEVVDILIDGSKAAIRAHIRLTSTINGQSGETEVADFIEVKDGRIVSFIQFCDTAFAVKLAAK
jgi:ketosteroid isomerase-like protein